MVILQNKNGQLGNRLLIFSNFIGHAIHYGYRLCNPMFDEYVPLFRCTREDDFGPYPISVRGRGPLSAHAFERLTYLAMQGLPRSPWHHYFRWRGLEPFDLNDPAFVALARSKAVFVFGWMLRDTAHLLEHAGLIRHLFTPDPPVMDRVRRATDDARRGADVLVGVHIRRGDYRRHMGGRYFFADTVYADMMRQTADLIGGNRRVRFLVCSNETVAPEPFAGLDVAHGPGSALDDLYALAQCDRLIGPPSTFTKWASFHGQVPLDWIRSADQRIRDEDFVCDLAESM